MSLRQKSLLVNISLVFGILMFGLLLTSFVYRVWIAPPIDAELNGNTPLEKIIQVNVLNATGVPGLANDVRKYLRDRGFDVVEVDNNTNTINNTVIFDRVGDKIATHKLAYALGINEKMIKLDVDSTLYLKASIIIGKDYKTLKPFDFE